MHDVRRVSQPEERTPIQVAPPSVHRLKSISVIGGFLDGLRLELADGLNCLIGARGTGKTTALELVRYAMDELPANPAERRRIESLVKENLNGGQVEVEIETREGLSLVTSTSGLP